VAHSSVGLAQTPDEEPTPTSVKALVVDTGRDVRTFPQRTSTWVILGLGGAAALALHPFADRVTKAVSDPSATTTMLAAGKYIGSGYTQVGAAVALYTIGRYALPHPDDASTINMASHLGVDMLRALAVSQVFTQGLKLTVQRNRPTGECCAFPSGHASATFATASVLERHFGNRGAWPAFSVATYVATSRLYDNRHFLSDVIVGSALGLASGWTVVGRHGREPFAMTPAPVRGGMMVVFTAGGINRRRLLHD
jgi:membrane-associated phospholipid phosphatase